MKKLVREFIENPRPPKDVSSILWDFWNQSRVKNMVGKDFHDSENDFNEYCELMKNEIDAINSCLNKKL